MEIRRIGRPEIDDRELDAYSRLVRVLDRELLGTDELTRSIDELALDLRDDDPYRARVALGAFEGDELVGLAEIDWERDEDASTAYLPLLGVAPSHRRRGTGSALLAEAERVAQDAGRPTLVVSSEHLLDPGDRAGTEAEDEHGRLAGGDGSAERVRPPQGDASIEADATAVRFATARGYALGQLDRISVLDVGGRAADFAASLAALGPGDPYRVVTWADRVPDDLVDSMAYAHERMSVDAPSGAISYELEHWDAARVRDDEERAAARGRRNLTAAAVAPDGSVAGFTVLSLLAESVAVEQWDTIVLASHRGHGLGMRLKLANLVHLDRADPGRERVFTWNADENEHMLAINVALGFRGFAHEAVWQRP
ncbi:GNAT family N-acetyltransferase [Agromyces sp. LHK192]|uniref:GNAT family N-acetyltransferase n=1 Tax=Agromyces sp. LHK192 TaxID=2498704 RepID=UPI0013E367BE|nr:GNAT family N-acetyltransferase [Agromyces sp. LHK192]